MKTDAFCRVSTDKDEQLDSLVLQKELFVMYAGRNGHELSRLYANEGITGTSLKKQEEFKHLIRDAEAGKFQMVVVKDISRFARNTVDALQSIRKIKSMGINTLFLTGKQVTVPKEEQFYHERPTWAIITPEVYEKAQATVASRRTKYNSGEPFKDARYSGKHIFSTLIKCEHCSRSFTRKTYTYANTRIYWCCVTNDQYTAEDATIG